MPEAPAAASATPHGELAAVIQAIHAAPPRLVYLFAGAGSLALHWLHAVAGSSRTVLEARDCYAPRSLAEIAGPSGAPAVSEATAVAMATWALARGAALAEGDWPPLGVACTAAIATDRARRGAERAFVAVSSGGGVTIHQLTMLKGSRDRAGQEALVSRLVIRAVAAACGVDPVELALSEGDALVEGPSALR
jgi:hypothetical protein